MRNIVLALLIVLIGVGAAYFFYRSSQTELPSEVISALRDGPDDARQIRIKWIAQRYAEDIQFWQRMIHHEDKLVRHSVYEAVARFRKNIPDFFYVVYDNGDIEDKLAIYSALVYIAPYCDLGFTERALADCAGNDDRLRKAAYSLLSLLSVEDWLPSEMKESLSSSPLALRWINWWENNRSLERETLIENFTDHLLARYCSEVQPVRMRAFETLRIMYGDDVWGLPSNATKPPQEDVDNWWSNNRELMVPRLLKLIEWDKLYYKGL